MVGWYLDIIFRFDQTSPHKMLPISIDQRFGEVCISGFPSQSASRSRGSSSPNFPNLTTKAWAGSPPQSSGSLTQQSLADGKSYPHRASQLAFDPPGKKRRSVRNSHPDSSFKWMMMALCALHTHAQEKLSNVLHLLLGLFHSLVPCHCRICDHRACRS